MRQAQRPIPLPRASGANPGWRGVAANDNERRCRAVSGNLVNHGSHTYTYDMNAPGQRSWPNRLKTITQGATTVTFAYDGMGRRLKQTVGATETRYLWCGSAICQQRDGADTVQKRFYSEGEYVHSGTKKYLTLTDHLGSVRDVVDITSTPTLVGSFDYRPYGEVARSWGTVTTGYTYARLFAQTSTGLLLSTTRAYNPANGKWLNVDPIREAGGVNLTGYVGGRPMVAIDPMGLEAKINGFPANERIHFDFEAIPEMPGVFIVGMHGDVDVAAISVADLAQMLREHKDYRQGMPIILMSCLTGKNADGYAAQLAKEMDALVIAPDKYWVSYPGGHYLILGKKPNPNSKGERFADWIGLPYDGLPDHSNPGMWVPRIPPNSQRPLYPGYLPGPPEAPK